MSSSLREKVFSYVRSRYGSEIEYLWRRYPDYAVFRHKDNLKWYGLVMDIPRNKLELHGNEVVDILNVKTESSQLADILRQRKGCFASFHTAGPKWVSIILDGTVPFEEICGWIDMSYEETASPAEKQTLRPPKEWVIPSNPKYFPIEHAFDHTDEIDWKQGKGIRKGDIVFMYVGAPVSAILYKCTVTETDIPYRFQRKELTITSLMRIMLLKRYDPEEFTFDRLKNEFDILAVRGPRGIPQSLSDALNITN
ncbi:MAG: MmcQ/YjbR family DNA-binding protein [Anaerolineaceae bacterium]|nr:MmcQ/YjbR family DNA-binding protein [Anaerolineaceae bacterium]